MISIQEKYSEKLMDHMAIRSGEQKLMAFIVENLNWKAVQSAIQKQFHIDVLKKLSIDSADIVVLNDEIAYQINFGPKTGVSVFMHRSGKLIEIKSEKNENEIREALSKPEEEIAEEAAAVETAAAIAQEIAAMIRTINKVKPRTASNSR